MQMFKCLVKMASVQRDLWRYVQCLLLILLCTDCAFADKNKHYNVSTLCREETDLLMIKKLDGAVLLSEGEYNVQCIMTFQTGKSRQRFMLRFERLVLDCNDHLYIFDGERALGNYKTHLSCDTGADDQTIFTQSNFVTLKYITAKQTHDGNGFKLIITAFKYSNTIVGNREFLCSNRFCITRDLTCDGVNNCGDNSDETSLCPYDTSRIKISDDTSTTEIIDIPSWNLGVAIDHTSKKILGMPVGTFAAFIIMLILCGIFIAGVGVCLCRPARPKRRRLEIHFLNTSTDNLVGEKQSYPTFYRHEEKLPYPEKKISPDTGITFPIVASDQHEENPPPYPGKGYSPETGITVSTVASDGREENPPPYPGRGCSLETIV